ncbi:MAG: hypothetical protein KGM24_00965, partial [Elusimicrobia bacterium]|nr:hypothetical protein [Elusimicrobiota bacterium]
MTKARAQARPHEKPHHPHWPLAALLFVFVFALGMRSVHEPSTWIALRTGRLILAAHALPRTDPFSYGAAGAAWTTPSWLADVLFAKLDAWGGPLLLIAFKSAVVAAAFALLLPINHGSPMVAAALLSVGACASWTGLTETPLAFDFLLFALFVRLLRPRRRLRWREAGAAAGLTALWANLHGAAAPLALWLVGLKVFKASLRTAERERLAYWGLLAACAAAFALNPLGWGVLAHAFSDAASGAAVWRTPLVSLYGVFLVAGLVACWFTLQQEFVTTLAGASVMALSLVLPGLRPLAVLAAIPVIALALGHALPPREETWPRVLRWTALAAALLFVYVRAVSGPLAPVRGYGRPTLEGAVRWLSTSGVRGRMFNAPDSGDELIGLTGRTVFSDRRQSIYTAGFLRDARDWPRTFPALDGVYRFDYAVLRNRRAGSPAAVFDRDPAWRLAYADDWALVYLKNSGADSLLAKSSPFRLLTPNRLWPDALDPLLARPREAGEVLAELDRWSVLAPDCAQALLWKAYALDRLKMSGRADRLLELAAARPALAWDPELQALEAFVLSARGETARAAPLYRRAEREAARLGRA